MYYTYSIKNVQTGKFYIGSRTAKCMLNRKPEDDLGVKYFSSSKDKELRQAIKEGCVEYHVLQEYDDAKVCWRAEQKLIALYWKIFGREMSYNHNYTLCTGDRIYSTTGISNINKNKVWYTNDMIEIRIYKSEEDDYINKGFHKGRLYSIMRNVADKHIGNKAWNKGLKCPECNTTQGKIWVTNGVDNSHIFEGELYLYPGYYKGMTRHNKNKPLKKFYWKTLDDEIKIMTMHKAQKHHPDWTLIGPVK